MAGWLVASLRSGAGLRRAGLTTLGLGAIRNREELLMARVPRGNTPREEGEGSQRVEGDCYLHFNLKAATAGSYKDFAM